MVDNDIKFFIIMCLIGICILWAVALIAPMLR
jgi:hypothetical protein